MPKGSERIVAVDLFCGAGGLSWGLAEACEDRNRAVDLIAVNHDEMAIATHERNHPWAEHYHAKVEELHPPDVADGDVQLLVGGPECTHYSTARGGKPVSEQKRTSPWHVLDWVEKLQPANVLLENVKEFASWGPIDEDGQPTRNGETFDAWVTAFRSLGYSVEWQTLNAADYGDATSRERLFVQGRRYDLPEWPAQTHSEDGTVPGTDPWRPAAEIIDWSDPGRSIWTRGQRGDGKKPLVNNTMQRIAEGLRRHASDRLDPFADAIAELGREDVRALQETVVPARYAALVARYREEPFLMHVPEGSGAGLCLPHLVKYYGNSTAIGVDGPLDTVTAQGGKYALATPYVLGQHSGSRPRSAAAQPLPTIAQRGAVQLYDPAPFVLPRNGAYRGLHSNPAYQPGDRPLHTVTARNNDGHLIRPSLMRYSHGGALLDVDDPIPTITTAKGGVFALSTPVPYLVPYKTERPGQRPRTHAIDSPYPTVTAGGSDPYLTTPYLIQYNDGSGARDLTRPLPTLATKDRFALVVPEAYPYGLDIRYRMLQPRELAAAMGFPEDYEFAGNKTEVTAQIGNAVPVNLARALVGELLEDGDPTLQRYAEQRPEVTSDDD